MMNTYIKIGCFVILSFVLSRCKNDCEGNYTIEGTIWNGTKNTPRSGIMIKAVAGKNNSLFSTNANVTDLGNARTDNSGYFKITYACNDEMTGAAINSPDLSPNTIDGLPINQNINRQYNIPDSTTILITITGSPLNNGDTIYLCAPTATLYYDADSYYNPFFIFTKAQMDVNNTKTIRIPFSQVNQSTYFIIAKGYQNLLAKFTKHETIKVSLSKLEPEINTYTLSY